MSYEYQEVINLLVKTDQMNVGLKNAEKLFMAAKQDLEHVGVKVNLKTGEFEIDLKKMYAARLKAEEKAAAEEIKIEKEKNKRKYQAEKEREQLIARELHIYRKESAAAAAKAEREEAVALHRYRMEMDKERAQAQKQQIKEVAQFNKIFMPQGAPLPISSTPTPQTNIHASAFLRAGAGAAGMLGMYPTAGALYGTANAMQALGVATISATKAALIFVPAIAGIGTAFAALKFVGYGGEFSRELARMSTLMLSAKASSEDFNAAMDRTAQAAFKISSAFNMDVVDVVKAFKDALSSGIDVSDLERFTTIAATLATATATGIQDTANLLTSIKDSYKLTVSEMTRQTELLFNAINVGKIQIPDYVNGFARLSDAGAAAGIPIEDLHIAIATMTRQGTPAHRVMTSMTALIHGLQAPSEKSQKEMKKLGIAFGEAAFEGGNFIKVVEDIKAKTQGGVGSIISEVFDDERARQAIRSLMQGVDLAKTEITDGMKEIGTDAVASQRAMNNLFDNWEKSVLSVTNKIKASSAATGGWFNQLFYGDNDKKKTDFVAKMEEMKKFAASGIARGMKPEEIQMGMLAKNNPKLFAADAIQRFNKGERPTGAYSDTMFGDDNTDIAGIEAYMAESAAAIEQAYAEAKDAALISVREINKEFDTSLRRILKTISYLEEHKSPKELSKVEGRVITSRATENQKQIMLDLADDIEKQKQLLEEARLRLAQEVEAKQLAYREQNIQPIIDQIIKANAEGGDKSAMPALKAKLDKAKADFAVFMEAIDNEVRDRDVLGPFVSELNNLTTAMENMRTRVRSQDPDAEKKRKAKADAEKKAATENLRINEDFVNKVERLYKEDVANYEKAQNERKKLFQKIDNEILEVAKRNASLKSDIDSEILNSRLDERKDDPEAQARIAKMDKERNLRELRRLAEGGTDLDTFGDAVSRYRNSAQKQRDAAGSSDNRRAERTFQADMRKLAELSQLFTEMFGANAAARKAGMSSNDTSVSVRSPQELAKAAVAEVKKEQEIMKIIADVKLNLEVDGNLSDKSQNDIANKVVEKVKAMLKNSNPPPSVYDPRTRNKTASMGVGDE